MDLPFRRLTGPRIKVVGDGKVADKKEARLGVEESKSPKRMKTLVGVLNEMSTGMLKGSM